MLKELKENLKIRSVIIKTLAMFLVMLLTFVNIAFLGRFFGQASITYATDEIVNNQDASTNVENVKFEVYLDANDRNKRMATVDMNSNELILYIQVKVQGGGVLREGVISFGGTNFILQQEGDNDKLNLDTIPSGNGTTVEIPIKAKKGGNIINLGLLDMMSTIRLEGKYTNNDGDVVDITGEKYVKVTWNSQNVSEDNNPVLLEQEIITNKIFKLNGEDKRIIQLAVSSGVNGNIYPIKYDYITVNTPILLDASQPEDVYVSTYGTEETNGITGILRMTSPEDYPLGVEPTYGIPAENTYMYVKSEQKINISVWENIPDSSNNIFWNKSAVNEFIITYIYPASIDVSYIQSNVENKVKLHTSDGAELSGTSVLVKDAIENEVEIEECSNITTFDVEMTNKVYKSNLNIGENINYATKWSIGISYAELLDTIVLLEYRDTIYNEEELKTYNNTFYKTLYLNKQEFLWIFGEEGYIDVYNSVTEEVIYQINNDSEADENGFIIFEYPENITNIYMKTSNPKGEGKLNIYNNKEIIPDGFTSKDILDMFVLRNLAVLAAGQEGSTIELRNQETFMDLESPVTVSRLGMNRTTLSTTQPNEVTFTITLKTDDLKYDLYENPVFEIELPSYIKGIDVADIQLLGGNGLEIAAAVMDTNQITGKTIIKIELEGVQEGYGANALIIIDTVLTTEKFMPSVDSQILLTFENGKETTYLEEYNRIDIVGISIQAEQGILLVNAVKDYKEEGSEVSAFKKENKKGTLEMGTSEKVVTYKGMIINNTMAKEYNTMVLGRLPFIGNKDMESGIDLGTTIDIVLKSPIVVVDTSGNSIPAIVYYSENGDATLDLEDEENGWSIHPTAAVKSYLIVIDCINEKEIVEFMYYAEILENLGTNEEAYTTYAVYTSSNIIIAPLLGLETEKEIELEVELSSSIEEGKLVFQEQNITYTITVNNIGEIAVKNIKITNLLPQGLTPINDMETEWDIDSLAPGETIEKSVTAYVGAGAGGLITNIVAVNADYLKEQIIKTVQHEVEEIHLRVTLLSYAWGDASIVERDEIPLEVGMDMYYKVFIENTSTETINNVSVISTLPEQLSYSQVKLAKYDNWEIGDPPEKVYMFIDNADVTVNKQISVVNIESIGPGEEYMVRVHAKGVKYAEYVKASFVVKCDEVLGEGNEIQIEDITGMISPAKLTYVFMSATDGEVIRPGETIEYVLFVKNEGQSAGAVNISNIVPKEIKIIEGKHKINDEEFKKTYIGEEEFSIKEIVLREGDILEIRLIVEALPLEEGIKSKTIFNSMTITGEKIEEIQTKDIVNVIRAAADDPVAYEISGLAWLDKNEDGKKDESELPLSGITVKLMDKNTKEYVKDENNKVISVKTDKTGKYSITGIEPGKYFVIFDIDHNAYKVTAYQANGVPETLSSDAITVTEEGKTITRTDEINVYNRDITNINIGLISRPIFDLKIDKYISKITVQNQDGTEVITYGKDAGKLAKVDIRARYLVGTVVVIEYTIEVSNVGEIAGYAKTIIDHSGSELKFNSEMNSAWYEGTNGKLYSKALENEEIKPGQSKTIKLILTKTMTSGNTGLTNNTAEIYEYYNEAAIASSNKGNEISSADVIITIRTGSPVIYISIIVMCMTILAGGAYIINKKVLAAERRDV